MSTPLFQEALIEAKKLREAATAEARNAVMEAISPVIKQMIDKEISGIILEQDEPSVPPPAPPNASPALPDAGVSGPVEPMMPATEEQPAAPMPTTPPEAAAPMAAPPILAPNTPIVGSITSGPDGSQRISIPIDQLVHPVAQPPVDMGATGMPPEAPPVDPTPMDAGNPAAMPQDHSMGNAAPTDAPPMPDEQMPKPLAEIFDAVNKLIQKQSGKKINEQTQAAPVQQAPQAPVVPPVDPNAVPAVGAQPAMPVAPAVPAPAAPIAPVPTEAAPVPQAGVAPVDQTGQAVPAQPQPLQEYKVYKNKLEVLEETVNSLKHIARKTNAKFVLETCEKDIYSLYKSLVEMKKNNAISPRLFSFNESRLELLHENLNLAYSYTKIPLSKDKEMKTKKKDSLKEFALSLFEGAEGFEKSVGHVDPEGDSEGGSAEHAHKASGNPHSVKAEAEKAKFPTKEKNEWPGKPSPESLLEQLEEEIAEFMKEEGMESEESDDDVVLEIDEKEVVAEAAKSRKRLKALREQAELDAMSDGDEDDSSLTLDIDLDGAGAEDIDVNVNVNGEPVSGDEDESLEDESMDLDGAEDVEDGDSEATLDFGGEGEDATEGEEEEGTEEEEALQEVRKLVRSQLRLLEAKDDKKSKADKAKADKAKKDKADKAKADKVKADKVKADKAKAAKLKEAKETEEDEDEDVKESVNEAKELRSQLQETQLLTARSLYLNKIFVRDDLSGAQKRKIVEYLDSARTISEAKEIYGRIVKVLSKAKTNGLVTESKDGRSNLNEGRNEMGFDTSRWQILAGVKKS